MLTTRKDRAAIVQQVNANAAIEGFEPDAADKELQQRFIDGEATVEDLLAAAQEFAAKKEEGAA
ncbi:MAG TPA: antitoxin VbhA family protein [Noviherbaspirillum sp.]|nr:antitoxin VbhA family protein [Noviherbaspirillum sp.]